MSIPEAFDDLFLFVKVIDLGSFSRAADVLNTTQPTITRRIRNLEERLGIALIKKRDFRGLKLTEQGEIIYNSFNPVYQSCQNTLDRIINKQQKISGSLKVALAPAVARKMVTPLIPNFVKQHENVTLLINYNLANVDLVKDDIDIAISSFLPNQQTFKVKLLRKLYLCLYATQEYVDKYGLPNTLEDLLHHKIIGMLNAHGKPVENLVARDIHTNEETVIALGSDIYVNNIFHGTVMANGGDHIVASWDTFMVNQQHETKFLQVLPNYTFDEVPYYLIRYPGIRSNLENEFALFLENCFK